jgi:capsular polysaccharide transport system permease protein
MIYTMFNNAIQIQKSVVYALLLRELQTRFGRFRLGYIWTLLEPGLLLGVLISIRVFRSLHKDYPGIDTAVFFMVGLVPFFMFKKIVTQLMSGVTANQGLLNYRQVKAIDPLIARFFIEGIVYLIVYLLFWTVMTMLGLDTSIRDPLGLIFIYIVLYLFSFGLGVTFCVIFTLYEESRKILPIIMHPLMIISAVFFPMQIVPKEYWGWLLWNPLVHVMELSRERFFVSFRTTAGDPLYLGLCTLGVMVLGLSLYWVSRKELVTR